MIALKHDIDWKRNSVALLLTVLGSLLIKLNEMFLVIFTSCFIPQSVIWAFSDIDLKRNSVALYCTGPVSYTHLTLPTILLV